MFWVYALSSLKRNYIYVGLTSNLTRRIKRHNSVRERITKPYAPFELLYSEIIETRIEAREREKYWKSGVGKEKLREIRKKYKQCLGGGIGRRAGFKIQFFRECGFDSHPRYFFKSVTYCFTCRCGFFYFQMATYWQQIIVFHDYLKLKLLRHS